MGRVKTGHWPPAGLVLNRHIGPTRTLPRLVVTPCRRAVPSPCRLGYPLKPILACVPLQNGLFCQPPHRHSKAESTCNVLPLGVPNRQRTLAAIRTVRHRRDREQADAHGAGLPGRKPRAVAEPALDVRAIAKRLVR